ncbi:hypothetical protein TanjilG_17858 [Lupinus angustifolius]|uniref:Uncharacterized protein n=1 Tax=Lupinus angustifolius TaxID=3871 RepID=A0A4P1QPZ0_LUPAN|nr:hypothetical protein TanjilG_17858 [Lupinus angustifolius]
MALEPYLQLQELGSKLDTLPSSKDALITLLKIYSVFEAGKFTLFLKLADLLLWAAIVAATVGFTARFVCGRDDDMKVQLLDALKNPKLLHNPTGSHTT